MINDTRNERYKPGTSDTRLSESRNERHILEMCMSVADEEGQEQLATNSVNVETTIE